MTYFTYTKANSLASIFVRGYEFRLVGLLKMTPTRVRANVAMPINAAKGNAFFSWTYFVCVLLDIMACSHGLGSECLGVCKTSGCEIQLDYLTTTIFYLLVGDSTVENSTFKKNPLHLKMASGGDDWDTVTYLRKKPASTSALKTDKVILYLKTWT